MFRSLRTKLTVLYAGLFGAALILVSLAVFAAISSNAASAVRNDLTAAGTVFDRVWALRSRQLQDGAALLSRDFGFREAMATGDAATIGSAVENLRARMGADLAFVVGVDGSLASQAPDAAAIERSGVIEALREDESASGVFMIGQTPYQAISAPILSPVLMGWMVFAVRLDEAEMRELERLSAIPLAAEVLSRRGGAWTDAAGASDDASNRLVDHALGSRDMAPVTVRTSEGRVIGLAKPLNSMDADAPTVLLLQYPMAKAMAPYRPLLIALVGAGVLGILLLVVGSWALARSVTKPIYVLNDAAQRLQRGDAVSVKVEAEDEIGRLAKSFNAMAAEIRERERRITHLALHDADTDLPNRRAMERRMGMLETEAERLLVVAAIGVDRFTEVRGAIGYGLSAALMREIGVRLLKLYPGQPVARLSTEVLGLAFEADDLADAQRLAARLQQDIEAPLKLDANTIDVSVAIGLAAHHVHADEPPLLIERASIALDQARAGKARVAIFDEAAYGDPGSNLSLMSQMRAAFGGGEMGIHLQPKLDLRRRAVTGVEALVRWNHPVRGSLPPDLFVGMAEETGHIRELTEWVLAQAIREQAELAAAGHKLTMSVNLSGRLLGDADFIEEALDAIRAAKGRICLEITETAVIDHPQTALRMIERLSAAGVEVAIDDYGSGLSSLAYLKRIPAHELKIDKAFITSMGESQRDALLVRSTIDLAHGLGMTVTAEGVETEVAMSLLAGMGCDVAQGYLVARPMPLKELLNFLAQEGDEQRSYA